jgi:hypothetical protein
MAPRDEILRERAELRRAYGALFDEVTAILFRHDPIGINFETNADEYEPEVGTILPRLRECRDIDDLRRVIREEFGRWFSGDEESFEKHIPAIADDVWEAWQRSKI